MLRALAAEFTKLKRSSLPLWTALTVLLAPMLSNVFVVAQESGPITVQWTEFFALASMTMGTWYGFLLFGLVTSFVFGREYGEGVAPSLLTVPTRREYFVLAKLVVVAAWILMLALLALLSQAAAATLIGLDGFTWSSLWSTTRDVLTVTLLVFLTQPLVALVAVTSRGVFAPMIFSAFGFSAGMIGGIAGWGDWLPWAMPAAIGGTFLGSVLPAEPGGLTAGSWIIAVGLFAIGLAATLLWVNRADSRG